MTTTTRTPRGPKSVEPRRESLLTDFTLAPVSAEQRRRAALAVCNRSSSVEEARELLDALGLLDSAILRGTNGTARTLRSDDDPGRCSQPR